MFVIEEELKKLPDQPGVYIMHDSRDAIIYIGKAVSLRKRVHQYFQPSHDEGIKKAQMVKQIARFEYIVTDSESSLFPPAEKRQIAVLWPLHERGSSQGYDRAGEQDLSAAHLQPEPAARHGEGPPVPELSHSSVHGALPGIYLKGAVRAERGEGSGIPERKLRAAPEGAGREDEGGLRRHGV